MARILTSICICWFILSELAYAGECPQKIATLINFSSSKHPLHFPSMEPDRYAVGAYALIELDGHPALVRFEKLLALDENPEKDLVSFWAMNEGHWELRFAPKQDVKLIAIINQPDPAHFLFRSKGAKFNLSSPTEIYAFLAGQDGNFQKGDWVIYDEGHPKLVHIAGLGQGSVSYNNVEGEFGGGSYYLKSFSPSVRRVQNEIGTEQKQ